MKENIGRALGIILFATMPGFISPAGSASAPNLRGLELHIHRNVNKVRADSGVGHLKWNERLASEARRHAANMASRGFFAHEDPVRGDLAVRLGTCGIRWKRCAENLYLEQGIPDPATQAVQEWLHSRGHRRNMLDSKLRETGVGIARRRDGTLLIVQEFLTR